MRPTRRVLVTGATGFVGRHVVASLPGFAVTAAVRGDATPLPIDVTPIRIAAIDERTNWSESLAGIDAVVHLAGLAHRTGGSADDDAFAAVNTRGTLRLAEAAATAGVRDFIHASSIAVHGTTTDGRGPFRETDAFRPAGAYGASKAKAEEGLEVLAGRSGMAVTAIRPPLVYGRGAPGNLARLEAALRRRIPLPLASVRNRRAFIGVANLADFIAWRLGRDNAGFEAFILADDDQPTTPAFVRMLADAMGVRSRLLPFPPAPLRAGLKAAGREGMADGLFASLEVDTGKIRAAGWQPALGLSEGLRAAFQSTAA